MLYAAPLLTGARKWAGYERDTAILALTPGIPLEWIIHVTDFSGVHEHRLKRFVRDADLDDHIAAAENASSITEDDGLQMLRLIRPNYKGAIPLYGQLWLKQSPLSAPKLAPLLGLNAKRIERWRRTNYFDPLTGQRL